MEKAIKNQREIILIVEGSKDKIEYINKNIDKWMEKQEKKLTRKTIKIINFGKGVK